MSRKLNLAFALILFSFIPLLAESTNDSIKARSSLFIIPNASYQQETSVAFGLAGGYYFKSKDISRISSIAGSAYYTLLNQFMFNITPKFFLKNGKYYVYSNLNVQNYPDFYYGIGNTPTQLKQSYISQKINLSIQPQYAVTKDFYVGGILSFLNEQVKTDSIFNNNKDEIFSKYGTAGWTPYHLFTLGVTAMYDTRDNHFYPYEGFFAKTTFEISHSRFLSSYSLQQFSLDVRQFIPLFENHVFAWQAYAKGSFSNGDIPFQLLPTIGGRDVGRGFRSGMYRNNLLLSGQTEYRIPIYKRLKAAAFLTAGDVLGGDHYKIDKLKVTYGAGLRFRLNDARVHLRVDFAKNNYGDKLQFYITASEAF